MENSLEMAIIERLSHKIATQEVAIVELELRLEQAIHTAQALAKENENLKGDVPCVSVRKGQRADEQGIGEHSTDE